MDEPVDFTETERAALSTFMTSRAGKALLWHLTSQAPNLGTAADSLQAMALAAARLQGYQAAVSLLRNLATNPKASGLPPLYRDMASDEGYALDTK